jgi:hypothetical protein
MTLLLGHVGIRLFHSQFHKHSLTDRHELRLASQESDCLICSADLNNPFFLIAPFVFVALKKLIFHGMHFSFDAGHQNYLSLFHGRAPPVSPFALI